MARHHQRTASLGREQRTNKDDADKRQKQLHELELKHQYGAGQSDLLVKDEDVRRLKVRILMLRDENSTLRDEIDLNNDASTDLAAQCADLGAQLEAKIDLVRTQEKQLRKQEREFSSLKAELQSMNNMNQDSTNLLAEKLALSRELAILKPELEHLRTQLTHQQATLAEKLALERQVNTLEVELANEKKATKRAMQKRESNDRVEDDLRKQLREAEKQLAAEISQRERLEDQLAQEKHTHQLALQDQDSTREQESDLRKKLQDTQKQLRETTEEKEKLEEALQAEKRQAKKAQKAQIAQDNDSSAESDELRSKLQEAETKLSASKKEMETVRNNAQSSVDEAVRRSDAFEKKFEKLKTKYRELQEQLRQCQTDLKHAQKAQVSVAEEVAKRTAGRQGLKKRKVEEVAGDGFAQITIATPSADDRPHKGVKPEVKKAVEATAVGEKSAFSITPFLTKSLGVAVEEPSNQDANQEEESMLDDTFNFAHHPQMSVEVTTTRVPVAGPAEGSASPEPTSTASAEPEKPKEAEKPKLQPKVRGRPKKVLGDGPTAKKVLADAPSAKKNTQPVPKGALKKAKAASTLDKVAEENQEDASEPAEKAQTVKFDFSLPQDTSTSSANASSANTSAANTSKGEETKKKKRKILGSTKTLFDDDGEETAPARKAGVVHHGGAKKRAPLAGGVRNAFAGSSFSPLKREKRGVAASFLA